MRLLCAFLIVSALIAAGCQRDDMWDQARVKPLGPSDYFADGQGARVPVEGTVARGTLEDDEALYKGTSGGRPVTVFPIAITKEGLERGQDLYNVLCSPCHAKSGDGLGMIVQRGYKQPASLHEPRLLNAPPGYFYGVMVRGYGEMNGMPSRNADGTATEHFDYVHPVNARKMKVQERWNLVAYIRALQLSQHAKVNELPADAQRELMEEINKPKEEPKNGEH